MNRREFAAFLARAAIAWPLGVRAQKPATMPLVGYLSAAASSDSPDLVAAFRQGLSEAGYTEGTNVAIEYRWANDDYAPPIRHWITPSTNRNPAMLPHTQDLDTARE